MELKTLGISASQSLPTPLHPAFNFWEFRDLRDWLDKVGLAYSMGPPPRLARLGESLTGQLIVELEPLGGSTIISN
jgi:hypothetical protein